MKPARLLRCAIYTRVSTEHGLEQEFNSLDAQREAAEAYVKSQAHEGWLLIRDRFDDGGYSGGSMERPALQALLQAVKVRRIDVIVVYKVDRLTRSLADFAKLVELFDAHGVSFVSVTQSFNTTSSMGRLTLNVLLSFAQFEREVTGERIRDKIAASKKKGLWMGGTVPYGYRLESRKLLVDPQEAQMVRLIFELYLEVKSLPRLAQALAERGILSRSRTFASGEPVGGKPFRTGALSHLLGNRMYLGEVNHRRKSYPGEHEAIITADTFAAVQELLGQRKNRSRASQGGSQALLSGLIFDDAGNRMTPVHASKGAIRYRYYQSWVLNHGQKDKAGSVSRVPAGDIERVVLDALAARKPDNFSKDQNPSAPADDMRAVVQKVTIHTGHVAIVLKDPDGLATESGRADPEIGAGDQGAEPQVGDLAGDTAASEPADTLIISWSKPSTAAKHNVLVPLATSRSQQPQLPKSETRARMVIGIAQARLWLDQLMSGEVADIASLAGRYRRSEKSVRSLLSLAWLAPDIVDAAVTNRLPRGIGITDLSSLPADWTDQRRQLGLA